jgi:acetyltransferase-like isoleucine patch superfamily enzyme
MRELKSCACLLTTNASAARHDSHLHFFVLVSTISSKMDDSATKESQVRRVWRRIFASLREHDQGVHSLMTVGDFTYGHNDVHIHSWDTSTRLHIGRFCSIAGSVHVFLGGNHRTDWISTYPFASPTPSLESPRGSRSGHPRSNGDVSIGNDVWIGSHVSIMSGITIGDGAVIAAFSHVVADVPSYAVAGGNPASIIRYRFDKETIDALREIAWWDWPFADVADVSGLLCGPPTNEVIEALRRRSKCIARESSEST